MSKRLSITSRLLAALFAFALVAAACGGDDDGDGGGTAGTSGGESSDGGGDSGGGDSGSSGGGDSGGESSTGGDDSATSGGSDEMTEDRISITLAIDSEPTTLDPQITQDGGMRRVMENVYERLIEHDLDDPSILLPRLAAELPTNIDETTWEVKIRQGVTFHNGEPFNAQAAKFAIDRELDPDFGSELLGQIDTITGVEVVDDYTIRITTVGPDPILPSRLYMIQMVPPDFTQNNDIGREAVGTGPYMMVEWSPGQYFDLVRNEDYWGPEPQIDDVRFVFIDESQGRVAALQAGDVHMATNINPEAALDVPQLITREGLEYPYLRMKNYEGPLQSKELRQAIAHSLNIDDYIEFIYLGQAARVNCQALGSGVFGYNPDLRDYPYDPERAEALVAQSGYGGEEISLVAPTGRWLKFEELSQAVVSDMQEVGINVDFQLIAFDPWLQAFLLPFGEGQEEILMSSTSNEIQDADRLSSLIGRGARVSSYANDELEAAMNEARTTLNLDVRRQRYQEVLAANCEDVGILPILTFLDIYGGSRDLEWTPRYDGTARVEDMRLN